MSEQEEATQDSGPRWQTLSRTQRRVAGVLVEKAKTTPENYPLTLNALVNGCNQKSNRFPQMQLDEEDVDESLDQLRALGAVSQVQGSGRVDKHRHLMYEWLGVDKVELAVMGELLLRGAQTLGELRGRAARMEKIPGISELRPVVESLRQKNLLIYLTPPGRGAVVTHNLYEEQELAKVRADHGNVAVDSSHFENMPSPAAPTSPASSSQSELEALREEVADLTQEVTALKADVDEIKQQLGV